ncbi:MAG: hypothetical protein M1813_000660 [Trichoglossum hirsutum]|nr:MAG: hypothetical protein M1813_000660 [Trichoglossum hirsutum]
MASPGLQYVPSIPPDNGGGPPDDGGGPPDDGGGPPDDGGGPPDDGGGPPDDGGGPPDDGGGPPDDGGGPPDDGGGPPDDGGGPPDNGGGPPDDGNPSASGSSPASGSPTSKSPSSSSSPSSSPSSCSSTAAPSCTQVCSLVTQSAGGNTTSCKSAVCQTIKGCSASATTRTTFTSTSTSSGFICEATCSACRPRNTGPPTPSKVAKRVLNSPSDYGGDQEFFFMGEIRHANTVPDRMREIDAANNIFEGQSSAVQYAFNNESVSTGVEGLHGCTALMVISQMGVYVAHFWERPQFHADRFETEVIGYLQNGDGPEMPGLTQFTGANGIFASRYDPQVVLMVPRMRGSQQSGNYLYPEMDQRIVTTLRGMLPTVEPFIYDYVPSSTGFAVENTPAGKALIQYDPLQPIPCLRGRQRDSQPMYRVWIENEMELQITWPASPNQVVVNAQNQIIASRPNRRIEDQKRDGGDNSTAACLLSQSQTSWMTSRATDITRVLPTSLLSLLSLTPTRSTGKSQATSTRRTTLLTSTTSTLSPSARPPTIISSTTTPTRPPPTPSPPSPQQYHMHVNEYWSCKDDTKNLHVQLDMWDAAGNVVCHTDEAEAGATNPLHIPTSFQDHVQLVVTPEHQGDYIQFGLGSLGWTSNDNDNTKPMYCNNGGWDPREGPHCDTIWGILPAVSDICGILSLLQN